MKSNWLTTMELVTMCMGISIISLGASYLFGGAILPPALVTGISIAGFCLTLSDYFIKINVEHNKFVNTESRKRKIVILMHLIAVYGLIAFPNIRYIEDIGKENLEYISTFASVIALILAIGYNNRNEVVNDITKQLQLLKANQENIDELKKRVPKLEEELQESHKQALQNKKEVEQLQLLLEEARRELKNLK
ncbi:coiled-coil domain-containing protein [Bacillus mycoides]|uniref:coiled-coil domain-containing protein n=1 Tax=Bacillus mycoides TaxID=1405 RepID=UPI003556E485